MTKQPMPGERPLAGAVAIVAGATRGAGRGIARALGEGGALVYCTGRSVRGNPSPYRRPETIEETAEMIAQAGGRAVAVRVDHTVEPEVEDLFARIHREHGRVDVLVNSIAGEDPMMRQFGWFWEADLKNGEAGFRQALLSHIITAKHAARLMEPRFRSEEHTSELQSRFDFVCRLLLEKTTYPHLISAAGP